MRRLKQIAVDGANLFGLCEDGTLWINRGVNKTAELGLNMPVEFGDWEFIEGPPEGRPDKKEPTASEIVESLRKQGKASQTVVGRGHELSQYNDNAEG